MDMFNLSPIEARIIGCLMEKSVVTPDQYPLTLNSLTNACNQKSSRTPVMSLDPGKVQQVARDLKGRHLVRIEENFRSGIEKYTQIFCNTNLGDIQFDTAQFAIICLLLLRGPQTPGELRTRSNRLHTFADNEAVVHSLNQLMERESKPFVVKLPRTPGRKDSEYMHLFSGPIDISSYEAESVVEKPVSRPTPQNTSFDIEALIARIDKLEDEVAQLKQQINPS